MSCEVLRPWPMHSDLRQLAVSSPSCLAGHPPGQTCTFGALIGSKTLRQCLLPWLMGVCRLLSSSWLMSLMQICRV